MQTIIPSPPVPPAARPSPAEPPLAPVAGCCTSQKQAVCCEPSQKAECCGPASHHRGATGCGCQ